MFTPHVRRQVAYSRREVTSVTGPKVEVIDWIAAIYNDKWYPGAINDNLIHICGKGKFQRNFVLIQAISNFVTPDTEMLANEVSCVLAAKSPTGTD